MNQEDTELIEMMIEGLEIQREKLVKFFDDTDDRLEFIKKHLAELPKERQDRYDEDDEYFDYLRDRSFTKRTPESEGPEHPDT